MKLSDTLFAVVLSALFAVVGFVLVQVLHMRELQLTSTSYLGKVDWLLEQRVDHEQRLRVVEGCNKPCEK